MTASHFARLVKARKIGRGKWIARCVAHSDNHPSLSIAEGKRGVLIRCMSNGCDTRDILDALGLSFSDLFFDNMTPQVRARTTLQDQRESLEKQLGLAFWLQAVEPGKIRYWQAAERRIQRELDAVRCKIEPVKVIQEWRGKRWQAMTQREREREIDAAYKEWMDTAGNRAG